MHIAARPRIVLLGMMARLPFPGLIWQTVQYLLGFRRLGYDAYYVEAHGGTSRDLMTGERPKGDYGSAEAAAFIASVMGEFDLGHQWALHARFDGDRYFGLTESQVKSLYASAALIVNYHGCTVPLPEHAATGRLAYLETDPVELEVQIHNGRQHAIDFMAPHRYCFTWGLNYGGEDCRVPLPPGRRFATTPPAILPDLWDAQQGGEPEVFTTVGNWRQDARVRLDGQVYSWSKHLEFLKFIDLPVRTVQPFELALGAPSLPDGDRCLLERHGWRVRDALAVCGTLDAYRDYVRSSRAEFTVAKDQNIRLRSGWFSERSAAYLAAGRPVVTQETGFSNVLPTGRGLFAFSTMDDIVEAVEAINADYDAHSRAARAIAREHFSYDVVLPRLLAEAGL